MRKNDREIKTIAEILGWEITELRSDVRHSYLVYSVSKRTEQGEKTQHKFARLYSQSTDRSVYRILEKEVECILIQGITFEPDNTFGKDCQIPVIPETEFKFVLTDWNLEFLGAEESEGTQESVREIGRKDGEHIYIIEENPMEQIYTQLRALTSREVAEKSVERYDSILHTELSEEDIKLKAEGVSYLVQNAIDYFDNASTENLIQRMLNLYYGTLALMEAEMLIYGSTYKRLGEIEKVTRNGHGMATFGDAAAGLDDFYVGVLRQGLFQAWLSHRGMDVSDFPDSRKKMETSEFKISLSRLLYCIPELENILMEVDEGFHPGYVFPYYDIGVNSAGFSKEIHYQRKFSGSYIHMIDMSNRAEKDLMQHIPGRITVVGKYKDPHSDSEGWTAFVRHEAGGHPSDEYHVHKGLSTSMVLRQLFGRTNDWEVYAVMILYASSIIVRYMPNMWAQITHGNLDRYKAVFYQFSRVAERELTQIFLEALTGKHVVIRHPQWVV